MSENQAGSEDHSVRVAMSLTLQQDRQGKGRQQVGSREVAFVVLKVCPGREQIARGRESLVADSVLFAVACFSSHW